MASTDNVLTPNERKWLALALPGLALRNGGDNPDRLDPKVEQMTLTIACKLGIGQETARACSEWSKIRQGTAG